MTEAWVKRYNELCDALEAKGVDPSDAALMDRNFWCREKVETAGALEEAEELIRLIDSLPPVNPA
jgi:uncharacterized protein (DUF2342 family)